MRHALAVLLLLGVAAPAAHAQAPPRRVLVIGDSLARDTSPFLRQQLPHWQIEEDISFARLARETARDVRLRAKLGALPPIIHISSGTGDDPAQPERFRRAVRRVMRFAGPQRCVVWANVWRLKLEEPTFATLNLVLAQESLARSNLRVFDWYTLLQANRDWLVDLVHVNAEGNAVRAQAVAHDVRACRAQLTSPLLIGPLPP